MLVREKNIMNVTNFKFKYDPNKLWSTDIFYQFLKSTSRVFRICKNIMGSIEKPPTKLPFEIVRSKTLVREKTGVSEGKNIRF